eukprot:TRINITY_DN4104_c0_g1_i2.p1 TRINITY_DN4104_c0_g1~~TRINITY_DN4104_c0_g1_i2.p1  ORF type:complete len:426 (-),score=84.76 TRINITY_DN4104_c0_g1_i2:18-1295(-)
MLRVVSILLFLLIAQSFSINITINEAKLQYPTSFYWTITTVGSQQVFGRVKAANHTDVNHSGPAQGILAQLGWGSSSIPANEWAWHDAQYNEAYRPGSPSYDPLADEYYAYLQPNLVGQFRYTFRYSGDEGISWRYATLSGADFDITDTGSVFVNSTGDLTAPTPASELNFSENSNGQFLSWALTSETDIGGYDVYVRNYSDPIGIQNEYRRIARTQDHTLALNLTNGNYQFYIIAFDTSYNFAQRSDILQVIYPIVMTSQTTQETSQTTEQTSQTTEQTSQTTEQTSQITETSQTETSQSTEESQTTEETSQTTSSDSSSSDSSMTATDMPSTGISDLTIESYATDDTHLYITMSVTHYPDDGDESETPPPKRNDSWKYYVIGFSIAVFILGIIAVVAFFMLKKVDRMQWEGDRETGNVELEDQ